MCGIAAIHDVKGADRSRLDRMRTAVAHRGPDAEGSWASHSGVCGLASTRLSLNDLVGGNQPLTTASNQVAAVVNGEFYDFARIREDLIQRGHSFKTKSDSEILLPLYLEHGEECLTHLRGEFAFVLWDERRQTLFAARDRFGIKPLFYAWIDGALMIASEIKALFSAGHPASWDTTSFIDHAMLCHGPTRTLFSGVRQVPPGHYLHLANGHLNVRRYWDIEFPEIEDASREEPVEVSAERLREALASAVGLRMRADVPVACFLSGGIDSAAVLGLATGSGSSPTAFTVQFHGDYDESDRARDTAAFNGVPFVPIPIHFDQMIGAWERAVWHGETIGDNGRGVARLLQSEAVRAAGFKAVLSGEGADEILGGYLFARHDFMRSGQISEAQRQQMAAKTATTPLAFQSSIAGRPVGSIGALDDAIGFTPAWVFGALSNRGSSLGHLLSADHLANAAPELVLSRVLEDVAPGGALNGRHPVHQSLYLWIKTMMLNMILVADRVEMGAPVESRVPFLDHHVAEVARSIPVPALFREGLEKYPLRLAVKDVVPEAVFNRPKQPFTAPHAMREPGNPMRDFMGDLVHGQELHDVPFFDAAAVQRAFSGFDGLAPEAQLATDQALMLVAHTCLLQRAFRPAS